MDRVCRVCMSGAGDLLDIFIANAESPSLEEMINECVEVKIKRDDQYPKKICEICLGDVYCAYRFKKNYQLTVEQLSKSNLLNIMEENPLPDETEDGNETFTSEPTKGSLKMKIKMKIKKQNPLRVPKKYSKGKAKKIKLVHVGLNGENKSQDETNLNGENPKKKAENERTEKTGKSACKICGKVFETKMSLIAHMNAHRKSFLHKCPHCKQRFNEIVDLSAHLVLHSASGGFKCPHCHKEFGLKQNLKRHLTKRVCTKEVMVPNEKENIDV